MLSDDVRRVDDLGLDEVGAGLQAGLAQALGEAAAGSVAARRDVSYPLYGGDVEDVGAAAVFGADQAFGFEQADRAANRGLVESVLAGELGLARQ